MIESKTEEELFQIAKDIYSGLVYTDRHLPDINNLRICFAPLASMSKEDLVKLNEVGLFYEYLDKASPEKINEMPVFFSVQVLNKEDTAVIVEAIKEREFIDSIKL